MLHYIVCPQMFLSKANNLILLHLCKHLIIQSTITIRSTIKASQMLYLTFQTFHADFLPLENADVVSNGGKAFAFP